MKLPSIHVSLVSLAEGCPLLQELEIHQCSDETISAVAKFQNVQILRLVGTVERLSRCSFTDVGLTILARSCRRLIKLELIGCEASFAGIAAIGQWCLMLEELTLSSTRFEEGWVAALSYYDNLRTLRLESCKYIDRQRGPAELLKCCPTLERLQLACCDLRDKFAFGALLSVCTNVKELKFQNCWGLEDETLLHPGTVQSNVLSILLECAFAVDCRNLPAHKLYAQKCEGEHSVVAHAAI